MKINYKSDFDFLLNLSDPDGQAWGLPTVPIRVVLFTQLRTQNYYVASYNPNTGECVNCVVDDACLRIVCDSHGLQPGYLNLEVYIDYPDVTYPDGVRTEVETSTTEIVLVPYVCEDNGIPTVTVGCSCKCPGCTHTTNGGTQSGGNTGDNGNNSGSGSDDQEESGGNQGGEGSEGTDNPSGSDNPGEGGESGGGDDYPDDPFKPSEGDEGGGNGSDTPSGGDDPGEGGNPGEGDNPGEGGDVSDKPAGKPGCDCECHHHHPGEGEHHHHHHPGEGEHHHHHHHHEHPYGGGMLEILGEIARANREINATMQEMKERLDKVEDEGTDEWGEANESQEPQE